MVTITNTPSGWEVRIDGRLWGTYRSQDEATRNAPPSGRDWN